MIKKIKILVGVVVVISTFVHCNQESWNWYTVDFENNVQFPSELSELALFDDMQGLVPGNDVYVYEMGATLFTDHAEKQRLVKLPPNTQMTKQNNGLPDFPDETLLAKTFYYHNDVQQPDLGQNIIETRVLWKNQNIWNIGTYLWNEDQTDAVYIEDGHQTNVSWVDAQGQERSIEYSVPKATDCASCHQKSEVIIPIGPRLRNLNIDITVDGSLKNQLAHFQDVNLLNDFDLSEIINAPSYRDTSRSIYERGRAYLDINCAHCHTAGGIVDDEGYDFDYATSIHATGILWDKDDIFEQMTSGEMPYIGTTTIDEEGVDIVIEFLESL